MGVWKQSKTRCHLQFVSSINEITDKSSHPKMADNNKWGGRNRTGVHSASGVLPVLLLLMNEWMMPFRPHIKMNKKTGHTPLKQRHIHVQVVYCSRDGDMTGNRGSEQHLCRPEQDSASGCAMAARFWLVAINALHIRPFPLQHSNSFLKQRIQPVLFLLPELTWRKTNVKK